MPFDSSNQRDRLWHEFPCPLCGRQRSIRTSHIHCSDCHWGVQNKARAILDGDACFEDMRPGKTRDAVDVAIRWLIRSGYQDG